MSRRRSNSRRPLSQTDFEKLQTDNQGNLFWNGKRVRLAGFSIHDAAAWATVALVIVIALANWPAIETNLGIWLAFLG